MNITPKENPSEFNQFLFNKIDQNQYQYKFLRYHLKLAKARTETFHAATSVINLNNEGGWILVLHGDDLLIYGENWDKEQFKEVKEIINLNLYNNYMLSGDSELIYALVDSYEITNFRIEKERIFYRSSKVNLLNNEKNFIRKGRISDLDDLAQMMRQYYYEEYNGSNNKSIEETTELVRNLVTSESIYVLKNAKNVIVSFCSILNPDIGILFTKDEYRKKGNGKSLLTFCSSLLLKENDEVYLMTCRHADSSNIVCKKVGFTPFYDYTNTRINND